MARGEYRLTRGQMFRSIPKHLLLAALCGAIAGVPIYFLKEWRLDGVLNLFTYLPIAIVVVNAAVLPIVIPGRHWSFGYIGMVMLFFMLMAGTILSEKFFTFGHSRDSIGIELAGVNIATFWALMSGGVTGILYGMIAGRSSAMVLGLIIGSMAGFMAGSALATIIDRHVDLLGLPFNALSLKTYAKFAWHEVVGMMTAATVVLHAAALFGAALSADREAGKV